MNSKAELIHKVGDNLDNVQLENGYTAIANEILEKIAQIKISPTQYRLIFVIWRYTYGFKRKEHELSLTFLAEATGCDKRNIQRELKDLTDRKIIYKNIKGSKRIIGFNKHYTEWMDYPPTENVIPIGKITNGKTAIGEIDNGESNNKGVGETANGTVGEIANQEIKNKTKYKENIYSAVESEILNYWKSKCLKQHKPTPDLKTKINAALKKHGKDLIIQAISNYATIYDDDGYYYKHPWDLGKFLKQKNGLPEFVDEGDQWISYNLQLKTRASPTKKGDNIPNAGSLKKEGEYICPFCKDTGWVKEDGKEEYRCKCQGG
ncbi:replication protein [Oxobacter pfennigii]|nr:replication protein [Oxobacter pfennigii]